MTLAETVIAQAQWKDGRRRRARCPLCARYPRSCDGFTEKGLSRHLQGWGNTFRMCPVMEVVQVRVNAYRQRLEVEAHRRRL